MKHSVDKVPSFYTHLRALTRQKIRKQQTTTITNLLRTGFFSRTPMAEFATDAKIIPGLSEENRKRLCETVKKLQNLTTAIQLTKGMNITTAGDELKRVLRATLVELEIALQEIETCKAFYNKKPSKQPRASLDYQERLLDFKSNVTQFGEGNCSTQTLERKAQALLAILPEMQPPLERRVWWPRTGRLQHPFY